MYRFPCESTARPRGWLRPVSVPVTVTVTGPDPPGAVAVIWVELATVTFVALAEPNVTVAFAWKPEPLIVTEAPELPEVGATLETVTELVPLVYVKPFLILSR